jgi:hypothetical protein
VKLHELRGVLFCGYTPNRALEITSASPKIRFNVVGAVSWGEYHPDHLGGMLLARFSQREGERWGGRARHYMRHPPITPAMSSVSATYSSELKKKTSVCNLTRIAHRNAPKIPQGRQPSIWYAATAASFANTSTPGSSRHSPDPTPQPQCIVPARSYSAPPNSSWKRQ